MDRKPTFSYYGPQANRTGASDDDFGPNNTTYSRGTNYGNPFEDQAASAAAIAGSMYSRNPNYMSSPRQGASEIHNEKAGNIDMFAKRASDPGPAGGSGGEGNVYKGTHEHVEDLEITTSRRLWVIFTWMVTWWIPSPLLRFCGRMGRPDVRMAWREKVAICVIIGFMWIFLLFIIIGLGLIVCPRQYVWTLDDVAGKNTAKSSFVAMRGSVYDITNFMKQKHGDSAYTSTPELMLETYSGQDVNASFPIPVRVACPQFVSAQTDPNYQLFYPVPGASEVDPNQANMFQHTMNRSPLSKELQDPNFYSNYALPTLKKFKKGGVVWKFDWVNDMYIEKSMFWRVINKEVFNMQPYFDAAKSGLNVNKKYNLLDSRLEKIMDQGGYGTADITKDWDALNWNSTAKLNNYNCMKNMFYVGTVDDRQSVRCLFTNYMLLAFACVLMLVVLVKFLAAMQFGNKKRPVSPIKFVVCQVPCYTEDDESLLKTITSLAALDYQDKHKLIFVICDGNIVGSGNEKSTPRIVLDILGVDPEYDPPGRDYLAIAEGSRRHNIGKVYSGLYEFEGHVVPFMVVVKVGTPDESNRSGNRGKRDSQILLMSFFNKVHFDLPMTPLELEIYHQMRHIIGVNPRDFEYLLQVDADTEVMPDSLSRLIAACSSDQRIAGICGETMLGNESKSWTTMMQVYEYFISHHMAKAFESLFGSVTCLPGCFCMYRMRSAEGKPLLIAKPVLEAYSELHVDTLHKKNLLSLGEDRYLTTLMMKHFPQFKYKFIHDAKCKTIAPEKWSVLLSQRRRWINSTIHNLAELMFLQDMCGFCFFSMRFVVFLDLFGTITMPTTLGYFIYLIYIGITGLADVGYISLILIGAIYGVQAIIFIMRREWQHVGWMLIYLCAYPLWSFILPIYSFWHMDDFSWGNTRVVVGDGKRKLIVSDDKPFNPNSIPQRRWSQYEIELLSAGVLNAPPPNMNPNAGSSKEDDRVTVYTRHSVAMGAGSRYGAHTPVATMHRASSPNTMININGSHDPRLQISTPVAQAQQMHQYQSVYQAQGMVLPRAMSSASGMIAPQVNDSTMSSRGTSYYRPQGVGFNDAISPMHSSSGLLASGAPMGTNVGSSPESADYSQSSGMPTANVAISSSPLQQYQHQQHQNQQQQYQQRESMFSSSSYGVPSMYIPQHVSMLAYQAGGAPTDEQLVESIRRILSLQDLNTVTKKSVRAQLTIDYGVDLTARKEFIGNAIELILAGKL